MQPYRIEHGIKIPPVTQPKASQLVSRAVATMNLLKKGESFLVKDPIEAMHASKQMRDLLRRERERSGNRQFTLRKTGAGVRFWRMK